MHINTKKIIYLINNLFITSLFASSFELLFFKDSIFCSFNYKKVVILLITLEIRVEYIIWGNWYIKLKLPLSSYILCIIESLKNNAFTVKYNAKEKKNKHILISFEL